MILIILILLFYRVLVKLHKLLFEWQVKNMKLRAPPAWLVVSCDKYLQQPSHPLYLQVKQQAMYFKVFDVNWHQMHVLKQCKNGGVIKHQFTYQKTNIHNTYMCEYIYFFIDSFVLFF